MPLKNICSILWPYWILFTCTSTYINLHEKYVYDISGYAPSP